MTNSLEAKSKYDEHKYTGFEWLGNIPDHWAMKRFLNQFSFSKGLNITKENLQEKGVPCVNYGEVHSKYGFAVNPDKHPLKCVSEDYLSLSPKSLLRDGDFVFADTSEDIEGSGNFTQLVGKHCVFAGYHTVIVRPVPGNNNLFLAYLFESMSYRNQIRRSVKGVKVYSITKAILKNTRIWLPGLKEQTAIANFLDRKTAQIDQAIAIKEKQIALLKERKQILIQNAVTRGLDPTVPMKDSGVEWIGVIPAHWEVKRVKHVTKKIGSGITPSGGGTSYLESGIPLLRSQNVHFGKIDLKDVAFISQKIHDSMSNSKVKKNDVLLNITGGSIGRCHFVEEDRELNVNQHVCIVRPSVQILPIFLNAFFASEVGQGQIWFFQQGGGREGLNFQAIKNFFLPIPDKEEQEKIVAFIEEESERFFSAISLQEKQIQKLKEYKATLINSAVTGKIKVVEEEPNQLTNGVY